MFYVRINKIKIFNNREGFLGLFNRAEMRLYSYATGRIRPIRQEIYWWIIRCSGLRIQRICRRVIYQINEPGNEYEMNTNSVNIPVTTRVKPSRRPVGPFTTLMKAPRWLVETFTMLVKVSTRANLYFHHIGESMNEGSLPFSPNIVHETLVRRSQLHELSRIY
jgi:hypothetical protein